MDFYKNELVKMSIKKEQKHSNTADSDQLQDYILLAKNIIKELDLKSFKTSPIFFELQNRGLKLPDLHKTLFWPRQTQSTTALNTPMATSLLTRRRWIQPLLKELRADFSYAEIAKILDIQSLATYHHWESGRCEIPFYYFLMTIDKIQGRLQAFIDNLPFSVDLSDSEFKNLKLKPKLYHQFFATPWMPTIMLALRLPQLLKMKSTFEQIEFLSENLKIPKTEIETGVGTLLHLQLIKIEDGRFTSQPKQFYAIPAISTEQINLLRDYWFTQAKVILDCPGFHKFEQHATTHESKEKIINWVTELREKIKNEVKNSKEPETLIHITWQVAEIL